MRNQKKNKKSQKSTSLSEDVSQQQKEIQFSPLAAPLAHAVEGYNKAIGKENDDIVSTIELPKLGSDIKTEEDKQQLLDDIGKFNRTINMLARDTTAEWLKVDLKEFSSSIEEVNPTDVPEKEPTVYEIAQKESRDLSDLYDDKFGIPLSVFKAPKQDEMKNPVASVENTEAPVVKTKVKKHEPLFSEVVYGEDNQPHVVPFLSPLHTTDEPEASRRIVPHPKTIAPPRHTYTPASDINSNSNSNVESKQADLNELHKHGNGIQNAFCAEMVYGEDNLQHVVPFLAPLHTTPATIRMNHHGENEVIDTPVGERKFVDMSRQESKSDDTDRDDDDSYDDKENVRGESNRDIIKNNIKPLNKGLLSSQSADSTTSNTTSTGVEMREQHKVAAEAEPPHPAHWYHNIRFH